MTLLLDTDVLIDLALDRQPFAQSASKLLDILERNPGTGFVAWHTLSNFYYLVSSGKGDQLTRAFLRELVGFVAVAPTVTESLRQALSFRMRDLEDAMQVAAALACRADRIVTRNLKHYLRSPIPAKSPSSVLAEWDNLS